MASCPTSSAELGGAQVGLQVAATLRVIRNDAIYPAKRIAVIEIDLFANLLGNRFRRLNDLSVDIGEVKVSVRRIGEITGTKPDIGGGQELHLLRRAMRGEGRAVREEDVTMYQVSADIAGEDISGVLLGKGVAAVDGAA